ncbi:transmembrane protein 150C-like isoform X2 [Betta splendens]|uniref:Transmembrane protein 150C-like isoform X2 n=1 Tax=Betta splendens TaxID=158456 RepID=A0A6P7P5R1_BETSP|nr:transmembrane protein 150C-like isoform X2 [Betta splendens]
MLHPWDRVDTMCNLSPWALLPLFSSGFTAAGFWLVDAAMFAPSSCIFSAVMNVSAFLLFAVVFLRYCQLKYRADVHCLNMSGVVVFSFSFLGMLITGNIPFAVDEILPNNGSYMTFFAGLLYCWMQTIMTLKVNLKKEGKMVGLLRVLLSTAITVCLTFYIYLMFHYSYEYDYLTPRFQWAVIMLYLVFFSTFAIEFRHYRFSIECTENSGDLLTKEEFIATVSEKVPLQDH